MFLIDEWSFMNMGDRILVIRSPKAVYLETM